jgi:hypothetical protein
MNPDRAPSWDVTVTRARPGQYLLRCSCGWVRTVYSDGDTAARYADGHRRRMRKGEMYRAMSLAAAILEEIATTKEGHDG